MAVTNICEPIDVAAVFRGGCVTPLHFRWNSRTHTVSHATGLWRARAGEVTIVHVAVVGTDGTYYEISFDTKTLVWRLEKLETA